MATTLEAVLRDATTPDAVVASQSTVQSLWAGYGEILRCGLTGSAGTPGTSVVVKRISPPKDDGSISHARKVRSYEVECCFYSDYALRCVAACPVPRLLLARGGEDTTWLVLQDLDSAGYPGRARGQLTVNKLKPVLSWLAAFHATFLVHRQAAPDPPAGLWESGCYWHLETRPDELAAMGVDDPLRKHAQQLDDALSGADWKTLVHGDAKLANFCFAAAESPGDSVPSAGVSVAAVDFQYVGAGVGVRDIAYLLSRSDDLEANEGVLLDFYFGALRQFLAERESGANPADAAAVEAEWRPLFAVAYADFQRFLAGWSGSEMTRFGEQKLDEALAFLGDRARAKLILMPPACN